MNTIEHTSNALVTLENSEMIREFATKFSNMIVEASDLAREVHALRDNMKLLSDQLAVANDAAAKAIEDRNVAYRDRDRANELREQADHAYAQVNAQRMQAERDLTDVRAYLLSAEAVWKANEGKLADAIAEAELYKGEAERLTKNWDDAIAQGNLKAEGVRAEKDALIASLRLEVLALKEDTTSAQEILNVSEQDCLMLRRIIAEAKLASEGVRAVLEGTLAAE